MRFPGFKYKALTLSYDDDVIFDKKLMEILDKHGLKCTFNLNSGLFAEKSGDRSGSERTFFGKPSRNRRSRRKTSFAFGVR